MPFLTKPQSFGESRTWDVSLKVRCAYLYTGGPSLIIIKIILQKRLIDFNFTLIYFDFYSYLILVSV